MHTEQAVHYFNLKDVVEEFYDDVREQNSTIDVSLTKLVSYLKQFIESLNKLNAEVKSVQESIKDDPELTRKFLQASETYQHNSVNLTELLNLIKSSNLQSLSTTIESVKSSLTALEQSVAAQS